MRVKRLHVRYELDLRDNVQRTLYFTGCYEPSYVRLLRDALRPGDVYVDVGAHIGIHTFVMARRLRQLGGGSVVAFEPAPDLVQGLQMTARMNGIDNVDVVGTALGSAVADRELRSDPDRFDPADAAVRSFYGPGPIVAVVPSLSLDSWMSAAGLSRLDVIKIDVEGAELEVLKGMREALTQCQPRLIGVEIRAYLLRQAGVQPGEVEAFLGSHGYEPIVTEELDGNFVFAPTSARTRH